jgi:hypothetical protein
MLALSSSISRQMVPRGRITSPAFELLVAHTYGFMQKKSRGYMIFFRPRLVPLNIESQRFYERIYICHALKISSSTFSGHRCGAPFSEDGIRRVVSELPAEKALGPDGFTGVFYRECWDIIKNDIVASFHCVYNLMMGLLPKLNGALLTLIPKKEASELPEDVTPISLIHSFAKLITKVLAVRLSHHIDGLVSTAHYAFICRQCIQYNFLYVRNLARACHRKKIPSLLLKPDISKAFDSVSWEYLLKLLHHRGFPVRWRNWISCLLSTSSSSLRLNSG